MVQPEQKEWQGKTDGGRFGQWFLLSFLKRVDVKYLYPVLYLVIPFYLLFGNKNSRRAIVRYFREHFGKNKWQAYCKTWKNYMIFGQVVLDKFAIMSGRSAQFSIEVENRSSLDSLLASNRGLLIVSAHVGNFELSGHCISATSRRVNGLMFDGETLYYQTKRKNSSERDNLHLIPVKSDMSHIFELKEALDRGEIVAVSADRMLGSRKSYSLNFLGTDASFPSGVFRLASHSNANVVSLFIVKEKGTKYRGFCNILSDRKPEDSSVKQSEKWVSEYVKNLESILHRYPEQWFNYYDFWQPKCK